MFNISRNTIDLWLKRREATGSPSASCNYQRGSSRKIENWEQLRAFAQANGHLRQQAMAEQWQGDISERTIGKAHPSDWVHAKKQTDGVSVNGTSKSDKHSRAQLSKSSVTEVVYVAEAGVDDTEDYAYGWCEQQKRFHALKLGHRTHRLSFRAGWCDRQVLAPPLTEEGVLQHGRGGSLGGASLSACIKPGSNGGD